MQPDSGINAIAHAIQLAVAPVFLLAGVGAMLAVLTNRLSRIVDRSRKLGDQLAASSPSPDAAIRSEFQALSRRARLVNQAITYCIITALLVCALIATLFIGTFVPFNISVPVALLFVAAMIALFVALLSFLRETFIATASLRIWPH